MSIVVTNFSSAAKAVGEVIDQIPPQTLDGPGLGEWTVRELVGHTSRSLITVIDYFARPVAEEVVPSPSAYYTAISAGSFDAVAVTERGRQAGRDLGEDPASRFHDLVDQAVRVADEADRDLVVHTIVGGMRVAAYLPTHPPAHSNCAYTGSTSRLRPACPSTCLHRQSRRAGHSQRWLRRSAASDPPCCWP